jgi:hypothetical protein
MSTSETDVRPTVEDGRRRHAQQRDDERGEAATIERDIDTTRADVRATLAALEHRLSFDRLVEMTVGRIRERGGEFAGNLTDTVTQNPVPVLLTSIGLGWMMLMGRRRGNIGDGRRLDRGRGRAAATAENAGRVGERVREAGARLQEGVESSRDALAETAESMRAGASRAAAATREQMSYAGERMERLMDEQPLLLGVLGLAAGALTGALLPTTATEDRFLGAERDKAVSNVARTSRTRHDAARVTAASHSAPAERGHGDGAGERPSRPH